MNNIPHILQTTFADMIERESANPALKQLREKAWRSFLKTGWPTTRDERWKYANVSFLQEPFSDTEVNHEETIESCVADYRSQHQDALLLVMVDGCLHEACSDLHELKQGITITAWHNELTAYQAQVDQPKEHYSLAQLNAALSTDGLYIDVHDDSKLKKALHILSLTTKSGVFNPAHVIRLGKESELTVVEHFKTLGEQRYFLNSVSYITLQSAAKLNHYKLQHEGKHAQHVAHTFVTQAEDSELQHYLFSLGGEFSRDELSIDLQGKRAKASTQGLYALEQSNQYIDHHIDIKHSAPATVSEMLYKGVIKEKARAVFNGKLYVTKGADKITAYQANHNLLLHDRAEVYSKPELEIYADDVKCKHGATTGQLDHDALFYLRSRGIPDNQARALLLNAFADELLQRVNLPTFKKQLIKHLQIWLGRDA